MEKNELEQLADRVGHSADRLVGTGNRLIEAIEKSSETQRRHNWAIIWLTGVIAAATVIYAAVTVWSVAIQAA